MEFITTDQRIAVENFSIGKIYTITFKNSSSITCACIGKGADYVMFQEQAPKMLFTLNMQTAATVDTIEPGTGSGTYDYDDLENKPQINSVTLSGNKSSSDLGLQDTISDLATIRIGASAGATAVQPAALETALSAKQDTISDLAAIRIGASAGATAVQPAALETALTAKQDTIDSLHKLSADLVDDANATNKFATAAQLLQIETNKNNILSNWELGKNYLKLTRDSIKEANSSFTWNGYTAIANQVTFTINEDLSITMSGTASATFEFILISRLSDTFYLPTGDYYLSGAIGGSAALNLPINRNVSGSGVRYGEDTGNGLDFTVTDSTASTGVWIAINSGTPTNTTFKPMIITKANKDNGNTDYQPHAMSNVELTAAIQAIQAQLANQ